MHLQNYYKQQRILAMKEQEKKHKKTLEKMADQYINKM